MSEKVEIVICLGSSCFSRGNKNMLKAINTFIKENNLTDRVNFHGGHCMGMCSAGPNLKINDKVYNGIDSFKIKQILKTTFDL